jgi:hypothetical protein
MYLHPNAAPSVSAAAIHLVPLPSIPFSIPSFGVSTSAPSSSKGLKKSVGGTAEPYPSRNAFVFLFRSKDRTIKLVAKTSLKPDFLGLRAWIPTTHGHVGVYDGNMADMDTFSGRWQTICENHGTILSHKTLALALGHAREPESWCDIAPESIS